MNFASGAYPQTRASQTASLCRGRAGAALLAILLELGTGGRIVAATNPFLDGATYAEFSEGQAANSALPPGTSLYLRLEAAVSTKTSHLREAVTARVVREVSGREGVQIPLSAIARGRIEKLIPSSSPTDRARLLLRFSRLEIPGQPPLGLTGHVAEIENARESVLPDGTIQGVLTSELPLAHLESALEKWSKSRGGMAGQVQKAQEKTLGKSDTSIDYPAGTDFVFVLDKPLEARLVSSPAVSNQLPASIAGPVQRFLAEAPQRAASKEGKPGDPANLVLIGNEAEIRRVFLEAGWSEAEKKSAKSIWETVRAVAADRGYGAAPVSQLYLFGRPEDLAFEKMLNTFAQRHHLRLWRSAATTPEGREIWLGAATHDTGMDVRPGVISHAIDPDLDAERAKVCADLVVTGRVAAAQLLTRPKPLSEGLTATGGNWKTDGLLLGVELRAQ